MAAHQDARSSSHHAQYPLSDMWFKKCTYPNMTFPESAHALHYTKMKESPFAVFNAFADVFKLKTTQCGRREMHLAASRPVLGNQTSAEEWWLKKTNNKQLRIIIGVQCLKNCNLTQNPQIEGVLVNPYDPSMYYKKRMQHKGIHCPCQLWGHVMHAQTQSNLCVTYSTSRDAQSQTHTQTQQTQWI